jgi:hypothetical protein
MDFLPLMRDNILAWQNPPTGKNSHLYIAGHLENPEKIKKTIKKTKTIFGKAYSASGSSAAGSSAGASSAAGSSAGASSAGASSAAGSSAGASSAVSSFSYSSDFSPSGASGVSSSAILTYPPSNEYIEGSASHLKSFRNYSIYYSKQKTLYSFHGTARMMNSVRVRLNAIKVSGFSPRRQEVQISIRFNDGKDKEIFRDICVEKSDDAAAGIINDIRQMEKRARAEFNGISFDNYMSIVIENEDSVIEKLKIFLSKVFEKSKIIKDYKSSDGYISLLNDINRMQMEF